MCWSNATLFYGLWDTTASLDFAATAHKATRPTFLAIDLIINRRRRGKLEIEGQDEKATARALPEEIWELVKDELLGIAVEQAEQDRLSDFRCQWCIEQDYETSNIGGWCPCHSKGPEPVLKHAWRRWEHPPCEIGACLDAILDSGILHRRTAEQLEDINALLKQYHLQLPAQRMWTKDGDEGYFDFDSLIAISLPLRSTNSKASNGFPTVKSEGDHEYGSSSSVLNFTPEALLVPADADRRFRRLVSNYRLRVVDRTRGSALAPNDPRVSIDPLPNLPAPKDETAIVKTASKRKAEEEKEKEAPKLFAKAEPRWMLWSLCETCD